MAKRQKKKEKPRELPDSPRALPYALMVAAGAGLIYHCLHFRFVQDDSFITFRYVRNLLNGHGLVFNVGERVEGYTTFLWTVMLAVPGILGLDLESSARILGLLAGLASIALLWRLSLRVTAAAEFPVLALACVALTAANSSFAYWTVSGMETPLFTALLVASAYAFLRERDGTRPILWTPILFLLLSLTRPEGIMLFGVTLLFHAADLLIVRRIPARTALKPLLRLALLFGIPLGGFMLWRLAYYGYWFPNTYYAKAGFSSEYLTAGIDYLTLFSTTYMLHGALMILPAALLLWKRRTPEIVYLVVLTFVYCAYVVSVGGDVLHAFRFFVPVMPFLYLFVQEALVVLASMVARSASVRRWGILTATAALGYLTLSGPYEYVRHKWMLENGLVDKMTATGKWLQSVSSPSTVVAASTIGAISYFSGVTLIDMLGLTDETIAHSPERIEGIQSSWRERKYNTTYLLSRNPEWIFFSTGTKPSAFAERALFLKPEFRRVYYPCYFHLNHDANAVNAAYRRSPVPLVDSVAFPGTVSDPGFINDFYDGMNRVRTPSEALKYLTRARDRGPADFALVHQEIAGMYRSLGDFTAAEESYRRAIAVNPSMVESHVMLGLFARERKDFTAAGRHFAEAVRYNPEYSVTWLLLGENQAAVGDTAGAIESLRNGLRRAPNNREAYALLTRLGGPR